jgi:hypothetical protein
MRGEEEEGGWERGNERERDKERERVSGLCDALNRFLLRV